LKDAADLLLKLKRSTLGLNEIGIDAHSNEEKVFLLTTVIFLELNINLNKREYSIVQ